jgi:hypothetical protein
VQTRHRSRRFSPDAYVEETLTHGASVAIRRKHTPKPASQRGLQATLTKKALHEAIIEEILEDRVDSSRTRVNFRGVKRKMSNYNLRPRNRQRTRRVDAAKRIRIVK